MKTKDFVPHNDAELDNWLGNFASQIPTIAVTLGITAAEATALVALITTTRTDINNVVAKKAEIQSLIGNKELRKDSMLKVLRPIVKRMKNHPAYNEDDQGKHLGVVGVHTDVDLSSLKPVLKGKTFTGMPQISWKKGEADGLILYVDRKDGHGFITLITSTTTSYTDKFKLPASVASAVWTYKAVYIKGDEFTGEFSDEIKITVTNESTNPGGSSES